ncbi:CLUMA_CG006074, isoform A [Clunio marinus]|uniref:CLUMA_CG006074, isoform A n=1 Tax=Clunio marinus TaxID=568069 RepID=A0A1J1HX01_9DIPT|nr:CLUMA_CG006074, isoform A [Clunio marinus]
MSIAVDRIQNYYQYKDAEAKYYQLLKDDKQGNKKSSLEQPQLSQVQQTSQESKNKKNKNKKKKDSVSSETSLAELTKEEKVTVSISKDDTIEDVSAKTDSGIVDEPSESSASKKKSKSKKQREKKAAAALAATQQQQDQSVQSITTKECPSKEKIVIDLTPNLTQSQASSTSKSKDKKKKTKNTAESVKPKDNENDKNGVGTATTSTLVSEIAKARQHIKSSLERVDGASAMSGPGVELLDRISSVEKENAQLRGVIEGLQKLVMSMEGRLKSLEGGSSAKPTTTPASSALAKQTPADHDDDDVDLFGSEDEDEEAEKIKEERVKAYAAKKSKKPALIAKSSILMDVKPWDDETDMKEMERLVRTVQMDGLLWGASKLVPLAYGIKKLQIMCVIEDDKVSVDELQEKIQEFEDFVQSVDIAAFNKI